MGYRNYIAPISIEEHDKIKDFTKEQLLKYKGEPEDGYVGVYDVPEDDIYSLGKYTEQFDKKLFSPVFTNWELQESMEEEHDFYLVDKEFLKAVIQRYQDNVAKYYSTMLMDRRNSEFLNSIKSEYKDQVGGGIEKNYSFDFSKITQDEINKIRNMVEHIHDMTGEWQNEYLFDLDQGDKITRSWKYEYAVFELIRIYKTFDWTKNRMIYYGY